MEIKDLQEYYYGAEPLRIFWAEGRVWMLADDLVDLLDSNRHNVVKRGCGEHDRAMLYGDFLGQEIGEAGLPIITLEAGALVAARGQRPKTEDVARWLITEVIPRVYKRHNCWLGIYDAGSVIRCNVNTRQH